MISLNLLMCSLLVMRCKIQGSQTPVISGPIQFYSFCSYYDNTRSLSSKLKKFNCVCCSFSCVYIKMLCFSKDSYSVLPPESPQTQMVLSRCPQCNAKPSTLCAEAILTFDLTQMHKKGELTVGTHSHTDFFFFSWNECQSQCLLMSSECVSAVIFCHIT